MLKDIKNTISQSAIYGLSRLSSKLTGIVLLPLYTQYFTTDTYGIIVRVEIFWQFLLVIFLFGLENGIIRWYSKNTNEELRKKFLFTVTSFLFAANLILSFTILAFSGLLSGLILNDSGYPVLIFLAALIAFAETFTFVIFTLIRINGKALMYSVFSIITTLLNLGLQIYFIKYSEMKLEGIFYSKIISPVAVLLLLFPYYLKHIKFGFVKSELVETLKFCFPILTGSIVWMLVLQLDRYFLGYFSTSSDVGVYGLAMSIAGILTFVVIFPFNLNFTVTSWKKLKDINAKRYFTKNITYLYFALIYISLALALLIPDLLGVFIKNPDYLKCIPLLPFIFMSFPFMGIHFIGIFSFQASGNTKYILYSYLISLVVNVVCNIVLIPLFHSYGAAITNVIAFFSLTVTIYIFSRKNYFFKYEWVKLMILNLVFVALVSPFYFLIKDTSIVGVLLKIFALILFPLVLYPLKFYEDIEVETVKNLFRKHILRKP